MLNSYLTNVNFLSRPVIQTEKNKTLGIRKTLKMIESKKNPSYSPEILQKRVFYKESYEHVFI